MDELSWPRFWLVVFGALMASLMVFAVPTQHDLLDQAVKDMPKAVTPEQQ